MSNSPKITIFACGGAGINVARYLQKTEPTLMSHVDVVRMDSSESNTRSDEEVHQVVPPSVASGAGKVRASLSDPVNKHIVALENDTLKAGDINIVVFSLGGGTGSVVGPLLIRELEKRGHKTTAATVGSSDSQLAITNTLNTLRSLTAICDKNKIYLPIQVFDNSYGRNIVDATLSHRLVVLIMMLSNNTFELDRTDKINWLNSQFTLGVSPGLRPLHVAAGKYDEADDSSEVWVHTDTDIVDAIMTIGIPNEADPEKPAAYVEENTLKARVRYSGIFTNTLTPALGIVGGRSDEIVKTYQMRRDTYETQRPPENIIQVDDETVDDGTGLVL